MTQLRAASVPPPLPFSKVCNRVGDAPFLLPFLLQVRADPSILAGQTVELREWEYAMALYALQVWQMRRIVGNGDMTLPVIGDIGGAGSGVHQLLTSHSLYPVAVIDPGAGTRTVEETATLPTPPRFDVLTCLSVIEHVEEVLPFLRACYTLLLPGGLLIMTTDFWDAKGEDVAHFHWMRKRIYNPASVRKLLRQLQKMGFRSLGKVDWQYPGPQCYDYSVASIVVTRP